DRRGRSEVTHRERFRAWMLGEPVDRPPFWLFWGPWRTTRQRWLREGMAAEGDFRAAFGPDPAPRAVPVNCGPCPRMEYRVLEEDADYIVHTDAWGIVRRDYKHGESMSEFLRFPVRDRGDWEQFREERLDPHHPDRLAGTWREQALQWQAEGVPIQLGHFPEVTVFGGLRWLLGDEECLVAFYTMPDLVHEIMDHLTDIFLAVFAQVVEVVPVDVIHIWEDMCGRQGPLISPRHWEEFMGPNYRRIRDFARQHEIPLISVDTDGDPDRITPPMMASGVNFLFPMEVAAGCDVNQWRSRYPDLAMMGGVDKRALALDRAAIDAELDRVWPAVEAGRYIPELDHLIPDDVPWGNYCYYAEALRRRILGS
ncbi:MAG: uroporphyrinogen decarboxylase family protein, partial [Gemmatimonadota bacterium]